MNKRTINRAMAISVTRALVMYMATVLVFLTETRAQQKDIVFSSGRKINVSDFNRKIRSSMDTVGITGMQLAIIDKDKVVFTGAYGYKDGKEKVDNETIFEACSLSKSFFAYLVYKLVDDGKLDLDKPIYQYMDNDALRNDPRRKLITTRMLLSHCSGIENWKNMNNPDSLEIVANPGEQYVYSGEGYHYLAALVQVLLNEPYEQSVIKRVLEPLQLWRSYTSFSTDGRYPGNYATGHDVMGNAIVPKRKFNFGIPAAGMSTTASDYANLIINFFNGKNFTAARRKDLLGPVILLDKHNPTGYYGPGFEIIFNGKDTIIAHGGANDGFRNVVFYSVTKKRGFVLLSNHEWGKKLVMQICKATVDLDLTPRIKDYDFEDQYPDNSVALLNLYKKSGYEKMMKQVDWLHRQNKLDTKTLPDISTALRNDNKDSLARIVLEKNISFFPRETYAYMELGYYYFGARNYDSAYKYFSKIGEFNGDKELVEYQVKLCEQKIADEKKAKAATPNTTSETGGSVGKNEPKPEAELPKK